MIVFLLLHFALLLNLNLVEAASTKPKSPLISISTLSLLFSLKSATVRSLVASTIDPVSPAARREFTSNTLLIDRVFDAEWINIMLRLEARVLELSIATQRFFPNFRKPVSEIETRGLLMIAINADNAEQVVALISHGAKFLSNGSLSRTRTVNYVPIEMAVVLDRVAALDGMLQYLDPIDYYSKPVLLGGLLIRAVQAGHLRTVRLLVEKYKAPFLKGSFLFQQSIMHRAPVNVVKYILAKFESESEHVQPFGRHQDFSMHLAIKYNNSPAFTYLFSETNFNKNIMNGDNLRPIDLIFTGKYEDFLLNLFTQSPQLRLAWTGQNGNTLLHLAVLQERLDFIKFAIQTLNFSVDCYNSQGQTALLLAAMDRKQQIVIYLLGVGAQSFQADNSGLYPFLVMARLNDSEALKFVLDTIIPSGNPDLQLKLISFTQTLIYEQNWQFVNVLFLNFTFLTRNSYLIPPENLNSLAASPAFLDLPALIDYVIKNKLIDPNPVLLDAVTLGRLEIVKILLANGVSPALRNIFGESVIFLAIKNNRSDVLRFLLSLGGWIVKEDLPNGDFVALITNGASFSPSRPSKLLFESRGVILTHFLNYFLGISETLKFDPKVLATICIQLEIFFFHYVINQSYTKDLLASLPSLINIRKIVAESVREQLIQLDYPLLSTLLSSVHLNNHRFLRLLVCNLSAHQIRSEDLVRYIYPANMFLIQEYNLVIKQL